MDMSASLAGPPASRRLIIYSARCGLSRLGRRCRPPARQNALGPLAVVPGLLARAVELQRALRAGGVGPLEDPVLPGRQAGKDFRLHGLRPGEAQVGLHADQAVGREAGAFLDAE